MRILIHWLIATLTVLIASYILPGVAISGFLSAIVLALVLGIINTFIKPALLVLTLPLNILTLGLFTFILNALLVLLAGVLVPGFSVDGFIWALLFSLLVSIINYALDRIHSDIRE